MLPSEAPSDWEKTLLASAWVATWLKWLIIWIYWLACYNLSRYLTHCLATPTWWLNFRIYWLIRRIRDLLSDSVTHHPTYQLTTLFAEDSPYSASLTHPVSPSPWSQPIRLHHLSSAIYFPLAIYSPPDSPTESCSPCAHLPLCLPLDPIITAINTPKNTRLWS